MTKELTKPTDEGAMGDRLLGMHGSGSGAPEENSWIHGAGGGIDNGFTGGIAPDWDL